MQDYPLPHQDFSGYQDRFALAVAGSQDGIWDWNIADDSQYMSPRWKEILGYADHELPNQFSSFEDHLHPEDKAKVLNHIRNYLEGEIKEYVLQFRMRHRNGSYRWILSRGAGIRDENGKIYRMAGSHTDITNRKIQEEKIELFLQIIEHIPVTVVVTDLEGRIEYVNPRFTETTGYSREEAMGQNPRILKSGKMSSIEYQNMWQQIKAGKEWRGEFYNCRKDGSYYWESSLIAPVHNGQGMITHFLAVKEDITERKKTEQELHEANRQLSEATQKAQALASLMERFDPLTGLGNRFHLHEQLDYLRENKLSGYLFVINIDRFKTFNNARGMEKGDELLKQVSQRMRSLSSRSSHMFRLGADEFAMLVILPHTQPTPDPSLSQAILADIERGLTEGYLVGSETVRLNFSIGGVSIFPQSLASAQELLRNADTALRKAKADGGNKSVFFEHEMDLAVRERYGIETDLRRGLAAGELQLFAQPQYDSGKKLQGFETLVRWSHPQRGIVSPAVFIKIAEESDLILSIGEWVLAQACNFIVALEKEAIYLPVSVNVSPREFHQPAFVERVKQTLTATGANPQRLVLEVTEGVLISDVETVIRKMDELVAIGVRFSIDDFGTGYSSLAYLKRLPISELKIDKTFVQDAPHDPNDSAIVDTILAIARHMKLRVIAEGVETQEQADFLNTRGEIIHQGYLFGKPAELATFLKQSPMPHPAFQK